MIHTRSLTQLCSVLLPVSLILACEAPLTSDSEPMLWDEDSEVSELEDDELDSLLVPYDLGEGEEDFGELELTTEGAGLTQKPRLWAPYPSGVSYRCTQGPSGSTSHYFTSTRYALDFDTPNSGSAQPMVAALAGKVHYVKTGCLVGDTACGGGFGNHVKLAHGGDYYSVYAHLSSVSVSVGAKLGRGQLVGYEGTTGDSSGDHLHFSLHQGNASLASFAPSVTYTLRNRDATTNGAFVDRSATSHTCGLTTGHFYVSDNACASVHDSLGSAKAITNNTTYLGESCRVGDTDYFRFGGKAGAFTATIRSTSESIHDCSCAILNAQGVELVQGGPEGYVRNDNYNLSEGCACSLSAATTATYYLKVYAQMPGAYQFSKTLP